jgi:hypothetical protein
MSPWYPLDRKVGVPQSQSGCSVEGNITTEKEAFKVQLFSDISKAIQNNLKTELEEPTPNSNSVVPI